MLVSSTVRKTLFAAGVLGALGFGSVQLFASPQPTTDGAFCNDNVCMATCLAKGYYGGYCTQTSGCQCYRLESKSTF